MALFFQQSPGMTRRHQRAWSYGFSLTEMIATISMLGVLAGIVILTLNGTFAASKEALAVNRLETLNRALDAYMTVVYEAVYLPNNGSTTDESVVVAALRFRNPNENLAALGSPFIDPQYNPKPSTSAAHYRLRWMGRRFELLRPGQPGSGLRIPFDGSDVGGNPSVVNPEKIFGK